MKIKPFVFTMSMALCVLFAVFQTSWAQEVERIGKFGSIDWIEQKVTATGVGVPSDAYQNAAQSRAMTERAAVMVARRNLLEVIKGVHIDSTTRVKNLLEGGKFQEDTIVSKIEGELQMSNVDDLKYLKDGSVEATVSIPISGKIREIIMELLPKPQSSRIEPSGNMDQKIRSLEDRVRNLESIVSGLKKANADQQEIIAMWIQFVQTWMDYSQTLPLMVQADYIAQNTTALEQKVMEQEFRFKDVSEKLSDISRRLAALESEGKPVRAAASGTPYTGLIIDARNTGFMPCLKPEIYGNGKILYPGDYIDFQEAVRYGFVRYYRDLSSAQKNVRIGSLPYTVKAKRTYQGDRGLEIDPESTATLESISQLPGNFLANCMTVIVF